MEMQPGPFPVGKVDTVSVHDPEQDRDVPVHLAYPEGPGPFPVVVFSHGAFCFPQRYDGITGHWASHGYVVVLPDHLDSPNNPGKLKPEQLGKLLDSRIRDMIFILDSLPAIAKQAGLDGKLDGKRTAVAGHSFGGMIAMIEAGLYLKNPDTGAPEYRGDDRFKAAVVMSGVGPMPQMAENAYDGLRRPLMASGGTRDVGNIGTGKIYPWEWRMSPYTLAPPGDKYSVVLENADHYLGGLICRADRGGDPDPQGVAVVAAMTTTFLDAYLKNAPRALRLLQTADFTALTGGRARVESK